MIAAQLIDVRVAAHARARNQVGCDGGRLMVKRVPQSASPPGAVVLSMGRGKARAPGCQRGWLGFLRVWVGCAGAWEGRVAKERKVGEMTGKVGWSVGGGIWRDGSR